MIAARSVIGVIVITLTLFILSGCQSDGRAVAGGVPRGEVSFRGYWMGGGFRLDINQNGHVSWEERSSLRPTQSGTFQLSEEEHAQILRLFRNWKSKRSDRQYIADVPNYSIAFEGKVVETQASGDENPGLRPVTDALHRLLKRLSA